MCRNKYISIQIFKRNNNQVQKTWYGPNNNTFFVATSGIHSFLDKKLPSCFTAFGLMFSCDPHVLLHTYEFGWFRLQST